jgi:peroxiredoxin
MKFRSLFVAVLTVCVCILASGRVTAQRIAAGFGSRPSLDLRVPSFSDRDVSRLVTTLDSMLATKKDPDSWSTDAAFTLWDFGRQLQAAQLTSIQQALVLEHLDNVERAHPQSAAVVDKARYMVSSLTIGKVAPDIVGEDLDGTPLKLSDYRGKVVLLVFSGDWCGICRTQYPYERLLLELYQGWPFAIVGVDSGSSLDAAKQNHVDQHLAYRSWWDGAQTPAGPIASTWNVQGWPTAYLMDADGVIRFVDLRDEDLLKGVRQLLLETTTPTSKPRTK